MSNLIEAKAIEGRQVYGVQQYEYTVDGKSGQDYAAALTAATLKEATSIEAASSSYAAIVRARERKLSDLGTVLATLTRALATMRTEKQESGDTSSSLPELTEAKTLAAKYGYTINVSSVDAMGASTITRRNAQVAQNDVQYMLDVEDNNLQQDMVAMQSLITKRDNAFSTASRIVNKSLDAAQSTIGNIE